MDPHDQQDGASDPYDIQPQDDQLEDLALDRPTSSTRRRPTPTPNTIGASADGSIRQSDLRCIQCGYNLTGITTGSACPECSNPVENSMLAIQLPTSNKAITSLVLGISSIPMCVLYGIPSIVCGILAIAFGYAANREIERGDFGPGSKGTATAGVVCGIIGLTLGLIFLTLGLILWNIP